MSKLSIYNSYVKKDNHVIVYNTEYENAIEVESNDINFVKEEMVNENSSELFEMGFLVDDDLNQVIESKKKYYEIKYSKDILNIMLIMTYKCNCCCQYCFEGLIDHSKFENEDIEKVVEYIIRLYNNGKYSELQLNFFGGEPTLELEKMLKVANMLNANILDIKYLVITNGTMFNEDSINLMVATKINTFQITLDGKKDIHDKRRPLKTGESCYLKIKDNLELLCRDDVNVTIRINIDSGNVDNLIDIYNNIPKYIVDGRNNSIYIAPVVGCKIKGFLETLEDRVKNLKKAWKIVKDNNLKIYITPPVYAPCPNDSFESAFYMDLCGNVYMCGGFVGLEDHIERVFDKKNASFWDRISEKPSENCLKCEFFHICMGGCKYETEKLSGKCQKFYLKEMYDEYYCNYKR